VAVVVAGIVAGRVVDGGGSGSLLDVRSWWEQPPPAISKASNRTAERHITDSFLKVTIPGCPPRAGGMLRAVGGSSIL
jgi:hypothetical protein